MFELAAVGVALAIGFAVLLVIALLIGFLWLLTLPFQLLGGLLEFAGWIVALPFLLVGAVVLSAVFAIGAVAIGAPFLAPLMPALLVTLAIVWIVRRSRRAVARAQ
jgi:hypothetical protein